MTARITAAIRKHHPLTAARVAYVEQDGDRWTAYDDEDRAVARGAVRWLSLVIVVEWVAA